MKTLKLICLLACVLVSGFVFGSCSDNSTDYRYVCVQQKDEDRWSILDLETGEILCPDEFENETSVGYEDGILVAQNKKGKWEYFNVSDPSKFLGEDSYSQAAIFEPGCDATFVVRPDKPIALINRDFEEITTLPDDITDVRAFAEGRAPFCRDGKWGYLDESGKEVIEARYDFVSAFRKGYALAFTETKINLIDKDGKSQAAFNRNRYTAMGIEVMGDEWLPLQKGDEIVFVDMNGEEKFTSPKMRPSDLGCYQMFNGKTAFYDGGQYGIIDKEGTVLVKPKYDMLLSLEYDDLYIAEDEDGYGIINGNGDVIVPLKYDELYALRKNRFIVSDGEYYMLINEKGDRLSDKLDDCSRSKFQELYNEDVEEVVEEAAPYVDDSYYDADSVAVAEEYGY